MAGEILGTILGNKEVNKARRRISRYSANENSTVESDQRIFKDLDLFKGSILIENLGNNGKELGQKSKAPLDKSLGKRPIGLSGVVENSGEFLGNLSNSNLDFSVYARMKQTIPLKNNNTLDGASIQGNLNSTIQEKKMKLKLWKK